MNDAEIKKFKQQLLSLKSDLQILEKIFKENNEPVELDQARVGRLTRMDAMQGQQMALEASRRHQQQLLKIEGSLLRIESGDYGHCYICGEEIDIRRLLVDPTNTRCMVCVDK